MDLSKIAEEVISLSEAIEAYWDTELPKRHPNYPFIRAGRNPDRHRPRNKPLRSCWPGCPMTPFTNS